MRSLSGKYKHLGKNIKPFKNSIWLFGSAHFQLTGPGSVYQFTMNSRLRLNYWVSPLISVSEAFMKKYFVILATSFNPNPAATIINK